jgi:hypothetical protein
VKQTYGADDYVEKPFEAADLLAGWRPCSAGSPQPVAPASGGGRPPAAQGGRHRPQERQARRGHGRLQKGLAIDQFSDLLHYYLAMTYEKKDMVFHAIDHYERRSSSTRASTTR